MKVDLGAVQVEIKLEDYVSKKSFFEAMNQYMLITASRWQGEEHLVVFPEFIPTLLYPGLFNKKGFSDTSVLKNLLAFVLKNFSVGKNLNFLRGSFLNKALDVETIYLEVFSVLAQNYNCYILAPSLLLPEIDFESAKSRHIKSAKLFNTSYLFNQEGKVVKKFRKKQLTKSENGLLFSPAEKQQQNHVKLASFSLGCAICYDMFFENNMVDLDSAGVDIVAVPSCNFGLWKDKLSYRPDFTQEQVWYKDGPYFATNLRENIRYLVNPMAVGKIGSDTAQGRSSIWSNGMALKLAKNWDTSEVINITVEI